MNFADTPQGDQLIDEALILADETYNAYIDYQTALQQRDAAIRHAITQGITMYQIAKALGMSQQAVRKIRNSNL